MDWTFVVRSTELEAFRRCRRAWDLSARTRQRYVPRVPPAFDFERAVRHALALSVDVCATCRLVAPCDAMEAGGDWQAILEADFRQLDADTEDESLRLSSVRPVNRAATSGAELQRRRAQRG